MKAHRVRIKIISILVIIVALFIEARLFYLQIIKAEEYALIADRQYSTTVSEIFDRGNIYFTEKMGNFVSAASLKTLYFVAINPKVLKNPDGVYSMLSEVIKIDDEDFLMRSARRDDPYEVIARGLGEDEAKKITELGIEGVSVFKERARVYPGSSLASHVLGFVGLDKDGGTVPTGKYGIERYFEDILARDMVGESVNFFAELFANVKSSLESEDSRGEIILTIEPSVQSFVEAELRTVHNKYLSDLTGAIVMDPRTGAVLAMAQLPNFDPNEYYKATSTAVYRNHLVEDYYELGSIFKPLTIASAIDAGVLEPNTTYDDKGFVIVNNTKLSNYNGKANGVVSMLTVLEQSLNTGAVYAMQKLGRDKFREYMLSFGLGEKTGIELPNETRGLTKNLESSRDIEYATASFGQGIAVSAIEMIKALSSIANGGVMMKPYIVAGIKRGELIEKTEPREDGRVIKEETAKKVSEMLTKVVDGSQAIVGAKLEHYKVAAKTGTAQVANNETGKYYDDRSLHSFFGYFPADDPRFIVLLMTLNPKDVKYSSESLTSTFADINKFLINYYEVPPGR